MMGPIRSCDHDEDNVHMWVLVNQKSKMAARRFQFLQVTNMEFYHKYCWNILPLHQTECFILIIVDIYTHKTGNKASQ